MNNNAELIKHFYTAFSEGNAEEMVSCYSPDILFEDPAFGQLKGDDAKNMWRMLIANSKGNIKIAAENINADERTGAANWTAIYTFSQTGRKVVNKISAAFEFKNGLIIKHTDHFSMWNWSRQALGWKGLLLGWTPMLKAKVRQRANASLKSYVNGKTK
jgi:ketosteroid isomerase-like protein